MKTLIQSAAFFRLATILGTVASSAGERADELKSALKDADKLEITETRVFEKDSGATFSFDKPAEIAELIKSLEFENEGPGSCTCSGDCRIIFYRKGEKLTSIGYHHGISLRWNGDAWKGDSLFTAASAKSWRAWFEKHGEPRFQNWHEAEIKHKKREAANRQAFLEGFPETSRKIIEGFDGDLEKHYLANPREQFYGYGDQPVMLTSITKLAASIPDRQRLAFVISKAIGTRGDLFPIPAEVELVLRTSELLDGKDFQTALSSSDPATAQGVARLFFSWKLSGKFKRSEAGPVVVTLIEVIAKHDITEIASCIYPMLGRFSGPEITQLLERIALRELKLPNDPDSLVQDLSFPHFACLLLAKTDSPRFQVCLKSVEAMKSENPEDKLALLLVRSIRGEKNLLPDTIFNSRSTSICLGALSVFEKLRTKDLLNLIITKATLHDWAVVREESVLTIERMTGKKWFQNGKNERAEWYAKEIREWWGKNESTFEFPAE